MKIALLSEKYTPDLGGLAISAGRMGHLLDSAGCKVRVFAPSSNLPASEKQTLPINGISVTRFSTRKRVDDTLVDWFELIEAEHKREPFDLIHAYFLPMAGFVGAYAGKFLGIPSVVSIRGNDIERAAFDPSKFSHVMYALQNASAVTTNASVLAKKAKALIEREIHLIPNGIDANIFKPLERNEMLAEAIGLNVGKKKEERNFVIGFVGELREKKGLATLLSGYTQTAKEMPVSLLIVGEIREGEDKHILEEFQAINPQLQITITGHIPHRDLPAYYSLMDIFIHPSLRDGMPNAVLEAMACEKAVIATPVGGMLDVIEDEKNGRMVPVNDAETLAQEIKALLNDEQLRKQLGENARKKIQAEFTPQKELEANLRIYKSLQS